MKEQNTSPLVSVIIPSYNQAHFIGKAINSVLSQSYKHVEILVIDDGSTDSTGTFVATFPGVRYFYQPNQGLAASRNIGIAQSKGEYLLFLDSDDWLLPDALAINVQYLNDNPSLAFVSGAHEISYENGKRAVEITKEVTANNYELLLVNNYIAMIATVMFRRWVFDSFLFDTTLKSCEDYDLYLKIARQHPILQHNKLIAVYYKHAQNMSGKTATMLVSALTVLETQQQFLSTPLQKQLYNQGKAFWTSYYTDILYHDLIYQANANKLVDKQSLDILKKFNADLYHQFNREIRRKNKLSFNFVSSAKNVTRKLIAIYNQRYILSSETRKIETGAFDRLTPISTQFGYDRGGPIDRYYIENFLDTNKRVIKGDVLEIGDNEYTLMYGGAAVNKSDILHIDSSNTKATIIGDLSNAPQIISNTYDCIILTQTLHLIYDFHAAIETCYRVLKPGGSLLLTVPGISNIAHDEWEKYWYWSFTEPAIERVIGKYFTPANISLETFGNVMVASSFLYGLGRPEISQEALNHKDSHYPLVITAKATK